MILVRVLLFEEGWRGCGVGGDDPCEVFLCFLLVAVVVVFVGGCFGSL